MKQSFVPEMNRKPMAGPTGGSAPAAHRLRMTTALAVSAALVLMAAPAGGASGETGVVSPGDAGDDGVVVSTDVTGDGNFINGKGQVPGIHEGPDTRPASEDGADLERIWFSTPYETVRTFGADGTVERVTYVPEAFRITIQTHGDVLPTFGPSLWFGVAVRVEDRPDGGSPCTVTLMAWMKGPNPVHPAADPPQRAETLASLGCGGISRVSNSYSLSVQGNLITMEYSLDALNDVIGAGAQLSAPPPDLSGSRNFQPAVRAVYYYNSGSSLNTNWGLSEGLSTIDEASPIADFVVGQDVPEDVVCAEDPEHPDCQA